jgi:cysteate synthase
MDVPYHLTCAVCARDYDDDGLRLRCDSLHAPALLRSVYRDTHFSPAGRTAGLARHHAWLPIRHTLPLRPVAGATFRNAALERALGVRELWVTFSGYHPRRGAYAPTATFKDVEAAAVVARFARERAILVTASAGNTAAALALACSDAGIEARIIVPESAYAKLPLREELDPCVGFVVVRENATYDDAIGVARSLADSPPFAFEGGVWNIARRDGIGTIFLDACERIGRMPDVYVQGIGSGAGAIAAYESAQRLVADGRFGASLPRLLLVQNAPMSPVVDAWLQRSPVLLDADCNAQRRAVHEVDAQVLATSAPPYAVAGGLFDALDATNGLTRAVSNDSARAAMTLFKECEGVDIEPAAGVALAGLQEALDAGELARESTLLLHVTGGGRAQLPATARIAPQVLAQLDVTKLPPGGETLARLQERLSGRRFAAAS